MRIEAMYISPVKSLALQRIDRARFEKAGIPGDRAFFICDDRGRLITQRECAPLVQIAALYDASTDGLRLTFPDGRTIDEPVELGQAVTSPFFGERPVQGRVLKGGWSFALSQFAGMDLHLAKADTAGQSFDGYPISMCTTGSMRALAGAAKRDSVDHRRFRQNLLISSDEPHVEDTWLGGTVRVGGALVRVKMRDSRCVITTRDPDTGEPDMDTLKIIAAYRKDQPKEVNFGVYATVIEPGDVAVGDAVTPEQIPEQQPA
jgi:uncharacterized protein YcbX